MAEDLNSVLNAVLHLRKDSRWLSMYKTNLYPLITASEVNLKIPLLKSERNGMWMLHSDMDQVFESK